MDDRFRKHRIIIRSVFEEEQFISLFDYGSDWKYKVDDQDHSAGFEAPAFDASTWATGAGAFGWNHPDSHGTRALNEAQINTDWVDPTPDDPTYPSNDTDCCLRKTVTIPAGVEALYVGFGIDDELWLYLDGVEVYHQQNGPNTPSYRGHFGTIIDSPPTGTVVVAVRARNKASNFPLWTNSSFFDMEMKGKGEVPEDTGGGVDVALAGTATAGGTLPPQNPTYVNDSNNLTGTVWQSLASGAAVYENNLDLDLGSVKNIALMEVREGPTYDFPDLNLDTVSDSRNGIARLFSSTDGISYTEITGLATESHGTDAGQVVHSYAISVSTRYLRLQVYRRFTGLGFGITRQASRWSVITGASPGSSAVLQPNPGRAPGRTVAIIDDSHKVGVSEMYNSAGELHFTLPNLHPQIEVIEPWQVHWAYEEWSEEQDAWVEKNAGIVTDFDATDDETIFYGIDYLGIAGLAVDERFSSDASPDKEASLYPDNTSDGSKYTDKTITEIVTDQIDRLIHDTNSLLGFLTKGSIATMDESITIYSTLAERLPFIAGLLESHRAGTGKRTRIRVYRSGVGPADYTIDVADEPGVDRDNLKIEYGGLAQGFQIIPYGDFGTRVAGLGRTVTGAKLEYDTVNTPPPTGQDPDYNELLYGRITKTRLWPDLADINDLRRRVRQYAAQLGRVGKRVAIPFRVDSLSVKDGWDITDSIPIDIERSPHDTSDWGSALWTVWGWTVEIEGDNHSDLTLSMLPKEDSSAANPDLLVSAPIGTTQPLTVSDTDPDQSVPPAGLATWVNVTTGHIWRVNPETGFWEDITDQDPTIFWPSDHGSLTGLGDDDHPQYLTEADHDALPHADPVPTPLSGALSNPPTELEIETLIGELPIDVPGMVYHLTDSGNGLAYLAVSDGIRFHIVPLVEQPQGEAFALTAASEGGWSGRHVNHTYYNGKTYFAYIDGTAGDCCVRSYTHSSGVVSAAFVLRAALTDDMIHGEPSLVVRPSDHKIIVVYQGGGTSGEAALRMRISTNAEDVTAFDAEVDLDTQLGGSSYLYCKIMALGSTLYLFFRYTAGGPGQDFGYSTSADGGATWAALTPLFTEATRYGYIEATKTSETRIDFTATSIPDPPASPTHLYHAYMEAGVVHESDGTVISTPFGVADMTLVWDTTADDSDSSVVQVQLRNGDPVLLSYTLFPDATWHVRYHWWDGAAWDSVEITDEAASVGGAELVTPDLAFIVQDVAGVRQMFRYTTLDAGLTWTGEQVTSGTDHSFLPAVVTDGAPDLRVMWLEGSSAATVGNTTCRIMGFGATAGEATAAEHLTRIVSIDGDKADLEALAGTRNEVLIGLANDTSEIGIYSGGSWTWVGGGSLTVEDEGTPLATGATTLDFVGAGVTATGAGAEKTITIPGVTEENVQAVGHYELLMTGASPPEPLEDGTGTDWLYVWVN